jgi:hypothetical protein
MNILTDHMNQTIRRIDAFLDNYTLGTLVIEDETVSLLHENTEIKLDNSYLIEIFDVSQYHPITIDEALNTYCSDADWYLFAGLEARVKRNGVVK